MKKKLHLLIPILIFCKQPVEQKRTSKPIVLNDFLSGKTLLYHSETGYKSEVDEGFAFEFKLNRNCRIYDTEYQGEGQERLEGRCKVKGKSLVFSIWVESAYAQYDSKNRIPKKSKITCQFQESSESLYHNEYLKCSNKSKIIFADFPKNIIKQYQGLPVELQGYVTKKLVKREKVYSYIEPKLVTGKFFADADSCAEPFMEATNYLEKDQEVRILGKYLSGSGKTWYIVDIAIDPCESLFWLNSDAL